MSFIFHIKPKKRTQLRSLCVRIHVRLPFNVFSWSLLFCYRLQTHNATGPNGIQTTHVKGRVSRIEVGGRMHTDAPPCENVRLLL